MIRKSVSILSALLISASAFTQSVTPTFFVGYGIAGADIAESKDYPMFSGNGILVGSGVQIGERIFADVTYQRVKGNETGVLLNSQLSTQRYSYAIDGFEIPINVNYLLRQRSKRFNIGVGAGLNLLKVHSQEWDTYGHLTTDSNHLYSTMGWIFSVRWRVAGNMELGANLNFSVIGHFWLSDGIMLRYTFKSSKSPS